MAPTQKLGCATTQFRMIANAHHSKLKQQRRSVAVVVAHPDDEVLWCGGLILEFPRWEWHVVSVCRGSDRDRSPRFFDSMKCLNAEGKIGDLDDGPEQHQLNQPELKDTISRLLGGAAWDMMITHGPRGEYTRHRRHEEVCEAVVQLWENRSLSCRELWMFAYSDHGGNDLPQANINAPYHAYLKPAIWQEKFRLITEIYGFSSESWEACTTPREEAFYIFNEPAQARAHVTNFAPD